MKEIFGVADDPPARRRWFHDDYFDLFVWQADGEVTLFQLCYGTDSADRALVWDKRRGFFHDGPPAPEEVVSRFDEAGNRYEMRRLQDGERFEIVKNLFDRARLEALVAPHAAVLTYRELQFFWLLEYVVA